MFSPVLSAQLITAPTGRPSEMRNLAPAEPPRPERGEQMGYKTNYLKKSSQKTYNATCTVNALKNLSAILLDTWVRFSDC